MRLFLVESAVDAIRLRSVPGTHDYVVLLSQVGSSQSWETLSSRALAASRHFLSQQPGLGLHWDTLLAHEFRYFWLLAGLVETLTPKPSELVFVTADASDNLPILEALKELGRVLQLQVSLRAP